MRRRLNKRGKIAVTILLVVAVFLVSRLVGIGKKDVVKESDMSVEATTPVETVSPSNKPEVESDETVKDQSDLKKERQEKEEARKVAVAKQNKADQQENAIYLTFDDGPSSVANELLDILDDYQMKGTFFMIGPKIEKHPLVVKRMEYEGHGLALHGITHEVDQVYSSQSSPVEEMIENQEILKEVTGVNSDLARLPYGSVPYLTEEMRYLLDQEDFNIWDWNVDSRDWEFKNEQYVQHTIQEIQQKEHKGETPVVLLHDQQETIKHLPELLQYIKNEGYTTKVLTNDMPPITFPCEGRCRSI